MTVLAFGVIGPGCAANALQQFRLKRIAWVGYAVDDAVSIGIVGREHHASSVLSQLAAVVTSPVATQHVPLAHFAPKLLETELGFGLALHSATDRPVRAGQHKERRRDSFGPQDIKNVLSWRVRRAGELVSKLLEAFIRRSIVERQDKVNPRWFGGIVHGRKGIGGCDISNEARPDSEPQHADLSSESPHDHE
jgi:hypothetical protein